MANIMWLRLMDWFKSQPLWLRLVAKVIIVAIAAVVVYGLIRLAFWAFLFVYVFGAALGWWK